MSFVITVEQSRVVTQREIFGWSCLVVACLTGLAAGLYTVYHSGATSAAVSHKFETAALMWQRSLGAAKRNGLASEVRVCLRCWMYFVRMVVNVVPNVAVVYVCDDV